MDKKYAEEDIQIRKEKLIKTAIYYNGLSETIIKMGQYYGDKYKEIYADFLDKSQKKTEKVWLLKYGE